MPDDPRPDAELFAAARRGEAAAFEALYRRHRDRTVRWAIRFGADRDTALDVLQETFLYLLRNLDRLHIPALGRLTTLLYPVVRNNTRAALRKLRRHPQADPPEPAACDAPADELKVLLARIPPEQREALVLRFVDGLTIPEIAAATDAPEGTVKSRLHRAIQTLRNDPTTRSYFT